MKSKIAIIGAISLLIAIIASAAILVVNRKPDKDVVLEQVTVAAGKGAVLVFIAQEQGYFLENGLEVEVIDYPSGKQAAIAMANGEVDIATASMSVLVDYSFNQENVRTFAEIAQYQIKEVVARKDHGIAQIQDLEGKRIGVTMGSAGEFALGRFLAFNGISMDEVELLDVSAPDMESAIGSGEADAVMTWGPYVYEVKKQLGDDVVSWPGDGDQDSSFILIATEDWLAAHADTAERFLAALIQAEDYVLERDDEARDFITQRFGYDPQYWASVWPKYAFRVRLSQTLIIAMEDEARWRIDLGSYGEVTEVPNYLEFIDLGPLDATRPDALRIIR